mgnify:CR=1 FL=1
MGIDHFFAEHTNIGYYNAESRKWYRINSFFIQNGHFMNVEMTEVTTNTFDCYVLPGFIDAHCHLLENPYPRNPTEERKSSSNIALNNALVAMRGGITTLKDMGGFEYEAIEIINRLQNSFLPRLLTSGCFFTTPGGHCSDHGAIVISCMNDFIKGMQPLIENKIKFCKIINSDDGFSEKLLYKMIEYAHELDMIVSCHAYTEKAACEAVLAGTDILEHAGDYSDGLLDLVKERQVIIIPTYVAAVDSTLENCGDLNDVSEGVLQEWKKGEDLVVPKLFKRKLRVGLGTDAGFLGTPCDSLLREIGLLHNTFSISIQDLLYSAYVVTPVAVGMANKLGKIADGYFADFLCYNSNPLNDINVLTNPKEVWIGGERVEKELSAKIEIRRLIENDLPSLSSHMQHNYFDCAELGDFWADDEILAWIEDISDYCIGAFVDNQLIGFCLTHYHKTVRKVHIENIFVLDQYRNEGIAHLLLTNVILHYCNQSKKKIRFVGLVDIDNYSSTALFMKAYFRKGHPMFWMQYNSHDKN